MVKVEPPRNEVVRNVLKEKRVSKDLAKDRNTWLPSKRNRTTHANMEIFKANLNGIRIKLTYFFPEKLNTKY